ncbi:MAG: hydroxyacid dehydrogenase [Armatimonadota bacterium]|nr:hydroxyacid dehydrogenase [Armatimonadota bacterium]MDR7612683.1 hydroxyacid dehydrogenase [Armatimonadota bacterium]
MERPRVLLTEPIHPDGLALLQQSADVTVLPAPEPEAVRAALADADAVVVRLVRLRAEEIDAAPRLRVIGRHGVGVDNVDLAAATRRRIPVVYTPGANAVSVAEHTLALLLAVARRLVDLDRAVREGRWQARDEIWGIELAGRTAGVVGVGAVGREVARRCRALGMRVLGYDPYVAEMPEGVERAESLDDLLRQCDVVSLHVPLRPDTRHLIGRRELAILRPGSVLINTSRGAVVDEGALAEALADGRLAGAGLDVFGTEPPPPDHPLLRAPRAVLTPHAASHTGEALRRMAVAVAEQVLDALAGRRPPYVANPEVYQTS